MVTSNIRPFLWFLPVLVSGSILTLGSGLLWSPLVAVGLMALIAVTIAGAVLESRVDLLFLRLLGIALIGYAFLGKGFAYLGVPPVFVGEIILGIGMVTLFLVTPSPLILRSPIIKLLLLYVLWGVLCTVPYIDDYGIESLRDAVLWGYSAFAVLVASLILKFDRVESAVRCYGRLIPGFLIWAPVAFVLTQTMPDSLPQLPGTYLPILYVKGGDLAVHLGGIGAFLLAGIPAQRRAKSIRLIRQFALGVFWIIGAALICSLGRGALLAVGGSLLIVLVLGHIRKWLKASLMLGLLLSLFVTSEIDLKLVSDGRSVSASQILKNVSSILWPSADEGLEGTRRWRLRWWNEILGYTVMGEHFWMGKGYGINLADNDGYQTNSDSSLRSPHNGHLAILARSGVPGLLLWLLLQGTFCVMLLRRNLEARRTRNKFVWTVSTWLLAYWAAFMVNGAFDVFLEGPQGGIWFWSLFGFGVAFLERTRQPNAGFRPLQ